LIESEIKKIPKIPSNKTVVIEYKMIGVGMKLFGG